MGTTKTETRALSEANGKRQRGTTSGACGLDVSVIVVSYNTRDYLDRCLQHITGLGIEIVVVDNGSTDGSAQLVENRFPQVQLVRSQQNLGFGAAANVGIERGHGRYYLVLNADAWPKSEGIERLVASAEQHPEAGILAPTLRSEDGRIQRSIFAHPSGRLAVLTWALFPGLLNRGYATGRRIAERALPTAMRGRGRPADRRVGNSAFVIGAALLLRADAAGDIGGFDSNFFMFNEDADLCLRMQKAGWSVAFVRDAEFIHVGAASTRAQPARMLREHIRSHLRYAAKHAGYRRAEQMRRILVLALRIRGIASRHSAMRDTMRDTARWLASHRVAALLASQE